MLGRGIDQILQYSCPPRIYEGYVKSAKGYVDLAIRANGPLPENRPVEYVWGHTCVELKAMNPHLRLINLETSVTLSEKYVPKGINYRMHPKNVEVLKAANIDVCSLANNHVLDWSYEGLFETLDTLRNAGIKTVGAGKNASEAESPVIIDMQDSRVIIFAFGTEDSGCPMSWKAKEDRAGINVIQLNSETVRKISKQVKEVKRKGDIVIASIHWGGNWGFSIPPDQSRFAKQLIDKAGVDLIHGHSSHHVKGIEVYKNKLIIYGCGDYINDYEGIEGYEWFRGDLGLMYFPMVDASTGDLKELILSPTQMKKLRVNKAPPEGIEWLQKTLNREGAKLGTSVERVGDRLKLVWK